MTGTCGRCQKEFDYRELSTYELEEWDYGMNYKRRATDFVVCKDCSREFRQMIYNYSHDMAYDWCRAGEKEELE